MPKVKRSLTCSISLVSNQILILMRCDVHSSHQGSWGFRVFLTTLDKIRYFPPSDIPIFVLFRVTNLTDLPTLCSASRRLVVPHRIFYCLEVFSRNTLVPVINGIHSIYLILYTNLLRTPYFHHVNTPFDPLKPNFCIAKLGFTGVYIIFLILHKR